ncbi:flagellar biosynthesis protein R [Roseibium aestuarii]|uniref:Flagellar biosynthesis protein R n=1 Tax=Roseibium aestuarii TaxID=2600299 RepID=A0ABW4JXB7_9HYPH|nr:flagellar biosynthesis protein R [Roseibium aestuarii]
MKKTKAEVNRILKHMAQVCQLSEWMLQKLEVQDLDLMVREQRILEVLAGGDLVGHDRFIANASRRLKSIAEEREKLARAQAKVAQEYARQRQMQQAMKDRLTGMMVALARKEDEQLLDELVDQMFGRPGRKPAARHGL